MNPELIPFLRLIPFIISLGLVLVLGRPTIAWLQKIGAGQRVRDDGPQRHLQKEGTPTMGGVLIVGAAVVASLVGMLVMHQWYTGDDWLGVFPVMVIGLTLTFASIGFLDDWLKIARGRSLGLRARQKLALQFAGAIVFFLVFVWLIRHDFATLVQQVPPLTVFVRFALTGAVWVLLVVGTSNAMNLADGLDGLAAGLCFIGFLAIAVIAWNTPAKDYGVVPALSWAGACLGFLWFNRHPARLFMGDVGSLALGATFAGISWLFGIWVLIGVCFVPFLEAASVIIQVISFKTTGRRVFKMSPIHHHFELIGWPEQRVVYTFWAVGALAAAVTVWVSIK